MTRNFIIAVFISGSLIYGFKQSPESDSSDLVDKEISKRVEAFKLKKEHECKLKAIERAEEIVDSIIHKEISFPRIDSVEVPLRPVRPDKEQIINIDSTKEIESLFKKQQ